MNVITSSWDTSRMALLLRQGLAEPCEHVEADPSVAYVMFCEDDSFGPVGRNVVCPSCYELSQNELSHRACTDCGERKPRKDLREWRWYDFYAPQGDEPVPVCAECWDRPTHQDRMSYDHRACLTEDAARW